jgi:hypothetical protein
LPTCSVPILKHKRDTASLQPAPIVPSSTTIRCDPLARTVETRQPSITNTLPYPADADDHTTLAERTSR